MKVYEIEFEFEVVVGLKDLNDLMSQIGFKEKRGVKGILSIKQTFPFIPDDEYLDEISKSISKEYQTKNLEIIDCKFKGYKESLEQDMKIPEENKEGDENETYIN